MGSHQVERNLSHDLSRALRENKQLHSVERHHNLVSSAFVGFVRFTGFDLEVSVERYDAGVGIHLHTANHEIVLGHQPG